MNYFSCVFLLILGIIRSLSFPTTCQVGEWQCSDGTCIQLDGRCDNFPDCIDGSDEDKCAVAPVCLEGLESCPQPNGTTICVDKAIGCGCGFVPILSHGTILSDNNTIGSSANVTCDAGYETNTSSILCQDTGSWGTAICSPKDCGPLPAISFGNITLDFDNNSTVGASASVRCADNYSTNTSTITCQASGIWTQASCISKGCGSLYKIAHGIITATGKSSTGSSAIVTCDAGYKANESTVACKSSGYWESANCSAKDCGPVPAVAFGNIHPNVINNTSYGASASVTCDTGYRANVSTISCQNTGTWQTAICKAKDCGPVPSVAFGKINLNAINNTSYGTSASVTCDTGYGSNVSTISCQSSGVWQTTICKAKDCGAVPDIVFGKIHLTDLNNTSYGASATVTCETGYETNVSKVICQSSGIWQKAVCKPKGCGLVPEIAFGKINLTDANNTTYGASARVSCDAGYETNRSIVSCRNSGEWDTAICKAKDCGPVPVIVFGKINLIAINNTTYGTSASVTCETGYVANVSTISCQGSGEWETAICMAKECGIVPTIAFGTINLTDKNNTRYGASAGVTCDNGYKANVSTISCQRSGKWEKAICKAIDCGPVSVLAFGKIKLMDLNNTTYGASAAVTCDAGYKTNMSTISCQSSGDWDTTICKAIDCGPVSVHAFGKIKLLDVNNSTYGASASITCDIGYEANVSIISCQSSGEWETTTCKAKECGAKPIIANGQVNFIDINNTSYGSSASISCDKGFEANVSKIACEESGLWETAVCKAKDCGPVPVVPHGRIDLLEVNNTTYGASANVTCDTGFQSNVSYITCQSSGVWAMAICVVKDCGIPDVIAFGNISLSADNNSTFGATAIVTCTENYVASMPMVTCLSTGHWENATCFFKGCQLTSTIPHGNLIATGNTSIGSFANVTCDLGYEASVSTVMCQVSGIWETAECKVKACGQVPTIKHGKVNLIDNFHTSYGDSAYVVCDTGYETKTSKVTCQSSGIWETALCTVKDCGHPPLISNGNITLRNEKMSTYGAEALINCNDEYVANVSIIKCQSTGLWEVAQCAPEGQLSYNRCTQEHGVCTRLIYENVRLLALKSSKCRRFCHCAHAGTLIDGSVTYKWVERSCPYGTLFDDNLPSPVCNHHYMVWC